MANTLNLGTDGNWATKDESVLAYNNENNNFKPLPFDFSRGSTATVVNKDGLIETVGTKEPRIDFKDDAKGALKLEPSRTNLITYSEAFDNAYWTKSGASVVGGFSSPSVDNPTSAFKLVEDTSTGGHGIYAPISITGSASWSFYVKYAGRQWFKLIPQSAGFTSAQYYDVQNGVIGASVAGIEATITSMGDGWYRCTASREDATFMNVSMSDADGSSSYTGDGTSGVYLYGAQVEQSSYATSYIPNFGTALGVTRLAETASQTVPDGIINSSEGVLYFEGNPIFEDLFSKELQINSGSSTNMIRIQFRGNGNIRFYIFSSGQILLIQANNIDYSNDLKVAVLYKSGQSKLYVNGNQIGATSTATYTFSAPLSQLTFDGIAAGDFFGKCKDLKVYNTALTDAELVTLTKV